MWKKSILIIVSLLAWGSLVAHDYIPHHHHEDCLTSHEVHHHSDELGEHHHDHHNINCHVFSFFDKKSNKTAIQEIKFPYMPSQTFNLQPARIPLAAKT